MKLVAALSLAASLVVGGCSREPPNATPEGAVREIIDRFARVHGEEADAAAVYELLSSRAKESLAARARRYSDASGKTIAPEAMLAPSRFLLRFQPQEFTAEIVGVHALVEVVGLSPEQRAKIPCVYEDDGWRVDLVLPELAPVRMRPGMKPRVDSQSGE